MRIELNNYQVANLRWLLALIHDGKVKASPHLDTGDWCGEIRWLLEQQMIEDDCEHKPNVFNYPDCHWPPLHGLFNGMKRIVYEQTRWKTMLERIEKVAALKNIGPSEKVSMIRELVQGFVELKTIKAIEDEESK